MQLLDSQTDEASLAKLGSELVGMLSSGRIDALASRFGYARAFNREASFAIQEDLAMCLTELHAETLAKDSEPQTIKVKYFKPNSTGLFAVVECFAQANNGTEILVELIVTSNGANKHASLEDLSAVV